MRLDTRPPARPATVQSPYVGAGPATIEGDRYVGDGWGADYSLSALGSGPGLPPGVEVHVNDAWITDYATFVECFGADQLAAFDEFWARDAIDEARAGGLL